MIDDGSSESLGKAVLARPDQNAPHGCACSFECTFSLRPSNPVILSLDELDEILDRIADTSSFSSVDLRERVKAKYVEQMRTNDALSRIIGILNSSKAK
jgi:hypothetical protein